MSRHLVDIEARFGEADKLVQLQLKREKRMFDATANYYAQQEKAGIEGMAPLLEKFGGRAENLAEFFKTQQKVALDRVKAVTPLLQLTKEEIEHFEHVKRAIILIDPCSLVPHGSPVWKCQFLAASCGCTHWETANATGACTCAPAWGDNHIEAKVDAYGQGQNGWRAATADGWFYFDIPARTSATTVQVDVFMNVHGFYIVRKATGSASFSLTLRIEGYQYGYSWGHASKTVLNIAADSMGREDSSHLLQFSMPVGADPFTVRVSAKLTATAKTGGAMAVGDFSTGAGNYIETIYCNTYG